VNVEEYISSGILEAYALGELSEHERAEVEKNLTQYPALRQELALIEETQEKLLMKAAIQPSVALKSKLFASIDGQKAQGKTVVLKPEGSDVSVWKFAAAAAVTIALVSSYLAFNYWNKWKSSESSLSELIAQNQRVAQDYNSVNERLDQIEKDMNIINNPAFNRVVMKGTANAPAALASVYWNESSREVYLSIQDMKKLAQENQYQLWAIVDGKPVDAGVFDGDFAGLHKMKEIQPGAAAFAITIEPRGGKTSPTMETMQVIGNVVKG
jgi:anti-sigma-K factor RskA